MASNDSNAESDSVEKAMNRVLQAEREAEQAIADCEYEARNILQAAQQRVKRIADRTDARITRIQLRLAQKLKGQTRKLERAEKAAQHESSTYELDDTALAAVVQDVAAELTGNRRSPGDGSGKSGDE
jgi:vacuolar-type H+-ATPase subunit H